MISFKSKTKAQKNSGNFFFRKYFRFRSSIYARVVSIIALLSVILYIAFGAIFKSVHGDYLNTVIRQRGDNIGSIIESSLYHSMLKNDKSELQTTLDLINTLPGIDDVSLYDSSDDLVYSSFPADSIEQSNLDCLSCHSDLSEMFPKTEKAYKIIDYKTACKMSHNNAHRQLLVRTPILNEASCYTSACHAHDKNDEVLGSLIIKIPLDVLDSAVTKSSTQFFILAAIITFLAVLLLTYFTRNKIRKPLDAIVLASEAVSGGDRSRRLEITPYLLDDMRLVSQAFNNMLDNLDAANKELENWSQQLEYKVRKKSEELSEIQNELIHIERIASLGKLSSSVAHEINNPLSGILTYSKLVSKQINKLGLEPDSTKSMLKYLNVIETETKRCGDIVKGLLDFSRKDQENFENKRLNQILKESYNLMAHQMRMCLRSC